MTVGEGGEGGWRPGGGESGVGGGRHEPQRTQPRHDRRLLLPAVHDHRALRQLRHCEDQAQVFIL